MRTELIDHEERVKAYKEYFGRAWEDIIDLWMVEDKTPEEAAEILGEKGLLDCCDKCKNYYLTRESNYCPYCGSSSY